MEKAKNTIKQALPWIATVGILLYVFGSQDYNKIFSFFREAKLSHYLPAAALLLFTTYNLDCLSQWLALNWYCAPTKYKDVLVARGVSFLLMLINFNLGQGGMVYLFYRMTKRSLKRVGSAFFFTVYGDIYSAVTLFTIITVILTVDPTLVQGFDARKVTMISGPVCAVAWIYYILGICYWNLGWHKKFLTGIAEWEILSSFREAKPSHYIIMLAVRAPIFFLINGLFYIAMWSFNAVVPAIDFIVKMPFVLLVSGLPIAVAGLGPTQLGWNAMFGMYIPEEQGTALSLAGNFAMIIVNTLIALSCLPAGRSFLSIMKQASAGEQENG